MSAADTSVAEIVVAIGLSILAVVCFVDWFVILPTIGLLWLLGVIA